MSMRIKLFVALPSEFPKEKAPLGVDVIYTGVGKVNAAIKATEILKELSPSETIVINYGSAGASGDLVGCLVTCKNFTCKRFSVLSWPDKFIFILLPVVEIITKANRSNK